ncbi:MAG: hypothetical protein ABIH34_01575 [Nanoarchaeota archaeon]
MGLHPVKAYKWPLFPGPTYLFIRLRTKLWRIQRYEPKILDLRNRIGVLITQIQQRPNLAAKENAIRGAKDLFKELEQFTEKLGNLFFKEEKSLASISVQEDRMFYTEALTLKEAYRAIKESLVRIKGSMIKEIQTVKKQKKTDKRQADADMKKVRDAHDKLNKEMGETWKGMMNTLEKRLRAVWEVSKRQSREWTRLELREAINTAATTSILRRIKVRARKVKEEKLAEHDYLEAYKKAKSFADVKETSEKFFILLKEELDHTADLAELTKILFFRIHQSIQALHQIEKIETKDQAKKVKTHLDAINSSFQKLLGRVENQDRLLLNEVARM